MKCYLSFSAPVFPLFPYNHNLSPFQLLFLPQCLADCIGMSSTLVRGEYNRAWNEVLLLSGNPSSSSGRYMVDLMHQPGRLLAPSTPAAVQYQTI